MAEKVAGLIERVTFHNPENGFAVLKVRTREGEDPTTVLCTLLMVTPGEHLEAIGRWVMDRDHGRQFHGDLVTTTRPETPAGIERFLGSGTIKGIGPGIAGRIVKLYGPRSLEILDQFPEVLLHIRGIGSDRLKKIRASWQEQKVIREIALFLQAFGIGPARAVKIFKQYGDKAIDTIKANPFQLADDIRGIGFRTADALAKQMGLDPQSPFRARAAVRYALQELTGEGHVGYPESGVVEKTSALADMSSDVLYAAIEYLVEQGELIREQIPGSRLLFLTPLHRAEVGVAESIRRLANTGAMPDDSPKHPLPSINAEAALLWVEKRLKLTLAEGQRDAIREICRHNLVVVTGGPGVGKTTLVRSVLEIFEAKKLRCVLAAPTGRAARRLSETSGRPASTIHRLLQFKGPGEFVHDARNPLEGDLFVLDESSMVDVVLGNQYLRAVPTGACLMLVGDIDQLPSVGPGTLLADLIRSEVVPVVRLTQIFRQAQESQIISAAYSVQRGEVPATATAVEGKSKASDRLGDFYIVECETPEAIRDMVLKLLKERIPQRFSLDPRHDMQVLTPMNRGLLGGRNLNAVLQQALNPPGRGPEVQRFGWTFRVGDRVIQTENNYDRDAFNGDMGAVRRIDEEEQELTINFQGRDVVYDFGDLDELSLAYALTIHKSQGSEYPAVIIPLHSQHFVMLQRNLLYTAITRGKQLVVLVGPKFAIEMAVRHADSHQRFTRLESRLRG